MPLACLQDYFERSLIKEEDQPQIWMTLSMGSSPRLNKKRKRRKPPECQVFPLSISWSIEMSRCGLCVPIDMNHATMIYTLKLCAKINCFSLYLFLVRYLVTNIRTLTSRRLASRGVAVVINLTMWFIGFSKWFVGGMWENLEIQSRELGNTV